MSFIRFFVRSLIRSQAPVPKVERRGGCSVSPRFILADFIERMNRNIYFIIVIVNDSNHFLIAFATWDTH